MRRMFAFAMVVLCALCVPAWAGEAYVGASYMDTTFEPQDVSFDSGSSGWKVFGGYTLIKYFAVELTYYDLGDFTETQGPVALDASIKVADLAGRGILPIGQRFELFARLGYSSVNLNATTSTGGVISTNVDTTDWELLYGVGVGFKFGKRLGIRAEWENWDVEKSLDAWSVGVFVRFGGK